MVNVFIVAPTPTLRAGLRALLASPDVTVVGEASGVAERAAALLASDAIVLADEAQLHELARLRADTLPAVVLLAGDERSLAALRALRLRGWALASPDAGADELRAAVLASAQGLAAVPLALAERLAGTRPAALEEPAEPLTAREREVLGMLSQGLSNRQIARALQISEHTVKFHVASIFAKLGASSRTEAVSRGARSGLITL
jgi:DNA-binding NarL/FixJ family response regulator